MVQYLPLVVVSSASVVQHVLSLNHYNQYLGNNKIIFISLTFMPQASSISFFAFSSERYLFGTGTRKNLSAPSKSVWIRSSLEVYGYEIIKNVTL